MLEYVFYYSNVETFEVVVSAEARRVALALEAERKYELVICAA